MQLTEPFNPNKHGLFRGVISWGGPKEPPPAKIKINIEISLFIIPIFKSYKIVNHRNFPQPSSLKIKDFTAISKSRFFALNFLATIFIRQNLGGALKKRAIKNEPIIVETSIMA